MFSRIFLQITLLFSLVFAGLYSCTGGATGGGAPGAAAGPVENAASGASGVTSIDSGNPAAGPSAATAGPGDSTGPAVAPAGAAIGGAEGGGGTTVAAAGPQTPSFPADVPVNEFCASYYQKYFYIREHGERAWLAHCRADETCWEREQYCRPDERCDEFPEEQDLASWQRCQGDRRCRELADRCTRIENCQRQEAECRRNAEQMARWLRDHPINSQRPAGEESGNQEGGRRNTSISNQNQIDLNVDLKKMSGSQNLLH